jgi:outer membrane scaffolding protein for murein synthesis (MipA/OmpV family)
MRLHRLLTAALIAFAPAAAWGQTETMPEGSVFDGDYLVVGAGAVYGPSYEGSDDYFISPVPLVQGRLGGIGIAPRPAGVVLDFIPEGRDPRIGFSLGPVATYSGSRNRHIKDPVVRLAGKLRSEIALGVSGGVTAYKVLNPYDSLSASVDVKWDVRGPKGGMQVVPQIGYVTPLSKAALVTLSVSAKHVDRDYANYYYSVSPQQSAASGLPVFQAGSGWASLGALMLAGYDLVGNLLDGGPSVFVIGSYTRLLNDARRNPYTAIRGSANQWMVGGGVAYTF